MSVVRSTPRCLKIIFACCALAATCYGQTLKSVTSGVTTTLKEVTCSGTKCWAVGYGGVIINSADGGTTWSTQTSGTTNDLFSVSFSSETQGTVVGASGTILDTSDGGTTWTEQTSGITDGDGSSVIRVSATDVIATYLDFTQNKYRLLSTTNGGTTWTSSSPTGDAYGGGSESVFADKIDFIDAETGWGCSDGGLITKTTNGGVAWTTLTPGTDLDFKDIFFFDANNGYAVGSAGYITRTTDGGSTWTVVGANDVAVKLYGVAFVSATAGCAVGKESGIFCTTDGNVWTQVPNPFGGSSITLRSIAFSSTSAVAVGNDGSVAVGGCTGLGLQCTEHTCTCVGGIAATGADCTSDNADICASCKAGWTLNGNSCAVNTCTCVGGTAATGGAAHDSIWIACTSDNAAICASCNAGRVLNGNSCTVNTCTCAGGIAATGADCTSDNAAICASCNAGWTQNGNSCTVNTCTCAGGISVTGAGCTSDKAAICASCNAGWKQKGAGCKALACDKLLGEKKKICNQCFKELAEDPSVDCASFKGDQTAKEKAAAMKKCHRLNKKAAKKKKKAMKKCKAALKEESVKLIDLMLWPMYFI